MIWMERAVHTVLLYVQYPGNWQRFFFGDHGRSSCVAQMQATGLSEGRCRARSFLNHKFALGNWQVRESTYLGADIQLKRGLLCIYGYR